MEKLAIIVQRYGKEINGGAEQHARLLAERLKSKYEVEVMTTCALEYTNWDNYYPEGTEIIDDIKVRRFKSKKKDNKKSHKLSRHLAKHIEYNTRKITPFNFLYLIINRLIYNYSPSIFHDWLENLGPLSLDLVDYIKENKNNYKSFIFFTYLYHPTNEGIREVANKSILIPTAHDETPFYFKGFNDLFSQPKFIMYNTLSEKRLVERIYPQTKKINSDVAGLGFDKLIFPKNKNNLGFKYFIYIGRIEENKGCRELSGFFTKFIQDYDKQLKLVMVGEKFMETKISEDIIFTGFVSEEEKWNYLQNAEALIIPSFYESLSMVTLEAMSFGKPVLANEKCEVLKDHILASEAGFLYSDYQGFALQMQKIVELSDLDKKKLAEKGKAYVDKNYQWNSIVNKFEKAIRYITGNY
ncbi:MAG: glycosyltransferase family 4 protein [Flavobacteriaceae bacterium]|jgi:glycosyltransferase involved in cell wall biosynthesis|nr:glycosyltransferase family 4 protein [Flavobacteriaceae bacterium]